MREFRFRGQRVNDRKWIHGDILTGKYHGCYIVSMVDDASRKPERINWDEVYPNTVGISIGVKDSAGDEIYEGDFVKVGMANEEDEIFEIGWDKERLRFTLIEVYGSDVKEGYGFSVDERMKVVGNIYDTPELNNSL